MKRYEVVVIVKSDLADEGITAFIERIQKIITERKGVLAKVDKWGKKRLAYEIKKQKDGFYFLVDFAGNGLIVAEIERNLKIDDRVLKFMTVKKEGAVTKEAIEKEASAAEAKKAQVAVESENQAVQSEEKPVSQADRYAADNRIRRSAPKRIYNREEQTAREE